MCVLYCVHCVNKYIWIMILPTPFKQTSEYCLKIIFHVYAAWKYKISSSAAVSGQMQMSLPDNESPQQRTKAILTWRLTRFPSAEDARVSLCVHDGVYRIFNGARQQLQLWPRSSRFWPHTVAQAHLISISIPQIILNTAHHTVDSKILLHSTIWSYMYNMNMNIAHMFICTIYSQHVRAFSHRSSSSSVVNVMDF